MHVFKDVSYGDDNIVLSFVYYVSNVNLRRMFWIVTNGWYHIVDKNVLNNYQDIILTPSAVALVANIVKQNVLMFMKNPLWFLTIQSFL
jgi:hypothetical protein